MSKQINKINKNKKMFTKQIEKTNRVKLQEAMGILKVGMTIRTNGDGSHTTEPFEGVIGEMRQTCFFVFSDTEKGSIGKVSPLTRGYNYSTLIRFDNKKGWVEVLDENDTFKVAYILKYETETEPIEEFDSLEGVTARIKELVAAKDFNGLKLDSIKVYQVSNTKKISVNVGVQIEGI